MNTQDANLNALWSRAIVEELTRSGVVDVCISPGSRSTPLTIGFAKNPSVRCHVHVDERAAAFYALGLAKSTKQPVVLVCTSGSAGAHYHPAIIEASYANVPLIALTADRPQSLMHCGAGQTIDQMSFYGDHVRAQHHLDLPVSTTKALRHVRALMDRVYAVAMGRTNNAPGPVHVNVPFEMPLEPTPTDNIDVTVYDDQLAAQGRTDAPLIHYPSTNQSLAPEQIQHYVDMFAHAARPVIVCGPVDQLNWSASQAICELAQKMGAPILADPLSHLRQHECDHVVDAYDLILRSDLWAKTNKPDLILRFGAQPTSKVYRFWKAHHEDATEILIDPYGRMMDELQQASVVLPVCPLMFTTQASTRLKPSPDLSWINMWRHAQSLANNHRQQACDGGLMWEGQIARDVMAATPDNGTVMVASSMPVRDVDAFGGMFASKCIANRGANGIDGLLATAFGTAMGEDGPVVSLIGDVATLHDVGGLLTSHVLLQHKPDANVTIVLINNSGGGIFSFLPIAEHDAYFKPFFITTQHVSFEHLAQAYGLRYTQIQTPDALAAVLNTQLESPGIELIEVLVDRQANVNAHKTIWSQLCQDLEQQL